jgi:hypothetical protein
MLTNTPMHAKKILKRMSPDNNWGLGIAKVVNINYEEFYVTLRTVMGASKTFKRVPIPLSFPAAGARHFLGAMPQVGDICIIGWMSQNSSGSSTPGTKTPVILNWLIPGVWPGRDWATTSDFTEDEFNLGAPKYDALLQGVYSRVRHKLRHLQPGNVMGMSAQGSDIVLDESVTLSNRRGNEFRLRDQDQAIVARSLQQFHAMAGMRTYSGMVQRDARLLAPYMVSDGFKWDGPLQADSSGPVHETNLPPDPHAPAGFFTPDQVLRKANVNGKLQGGMFPLDSHTDPYQFMQRGGYINSNGFLMDNSSIPDAVYGGKPIYRVSLQSKENAALHPDIQTLTEHRIELTHTSDGKLPVTEQTDMFDADRLPDSMNAGPGPKVPFIEHVYGSVVGNDPFSENGRTKYGLPIVPVVFENGQPAAQLKAAVITSPNSSVPSTDIGDHACMLFRMSPPIDDKRGDIFWSVNKRGQFFANVPGGPGESSADINLDGDFNLRIGGRWNFNSQGALNLTSDNPDGISVQAMKGPVKIYGGDTVKDNETVMGNNGDVPSTDIGARTNLRLSANKKVLVQGETAEISSSVIQLSAGNSIAIDGQKQISMTTNMWTALCNGQAQWSFGGYKDLLPTNAPLHERNYTPTYPGFDAETVNYNFGNRTENFFLGNHTTSILIGDMTYQTVVGKWQAVASVNSMEISNAGILGSAIIGTVSLDAVTGAVSISAMTGVSIQASSGPARLAGTTGVNLGAPITGPDAGPIICAGSLEPFTGLPFATWGMGAKMHNVTA